MSFLDSSGLSRFKSKLDVLFSGKLNTSLKGAANGLAELDENGKVPSGQLPSYVDDVLEFATYSNLPLTGESGKIYVTLNDNKSYRWSGSVYVNIASDLALGETASTAHRGDHGAAAYAHAVTNKGVAYSSGLYKITTNSEGHVTDALTVQKSDITALGIPAQDTTYENLSPVSGSSAESLVSRGEKYAWGLKVDGPDSSTDEHIAVFDGTDGKNIKDSGFTIGTSVPAGAVFTDTTYESKAAADGGMAESLVLTGEKYTWNQKYTKPQNGIPASDLALGVLPFDMTGATAQDDGAHGLVPAPEAGDEEKYLKGDGTWANVPDELPSVSSTDNDKVLKVVSGSWAAASNLPDVTEYASQSSFPVTGEANHLYIDKSDDTMYRWDTTAAEYVAISSSGGGSSCGDFDVNILTTDWVGNGPYSYTWTNSIVQTTSLIDVNLKKAGRDVLQGDLDFSLSGRNVVISVDTKPTATLPLTIRVISPGEATIVSNFSGATASTDGTAGLVPAPTQGNQGKFLKADGTWATVSPGVKEYATQSAFPATGETNCIYIDKSTNGTYRWDTTESDYVRLTAGNDESFGEFEVSILTTDWTGNGPYTYTWQNSIVKSDSFVDVFYRNGIRNSLTSDIEYSKSNGAVTIVVDEMPEGTVPITIRVISSGVAASSSAQIEQLNFNPEVMINAIESITGVGDATVVLNRSNSTVNGIPAKSMRVLVYNGSANTIAETIKNTNTSGLATDGTVERTIDGVTVKFSRPTMVAVSVTIALKSSSTLDMTTLEGNIKTAVFNYINALSIGEAIQVSHVKDAIMQGAGTVASTFEIQDLNINGTFGVKRDCYDTAWNEICTCPAQSNITITTSVATEDTKIESIRSNDAIVQDGATASQAITAGSYVDWQGTMYTADDDISSGDTFATSGNDKNLTVCTGGALNALNSGINTVNSSVTTLGGRVTDLENMIVYGSTEPSSPVEGMIWLQPKS